jgi:hypothetical protein
MKTRPSLRIILTVLAVVAGGSFLAAQSGNGLLLPFPDEAEMKGGALQPEKASPAIPGRASTLSADETKRALELADTFLRRQQSEVSSSIPRRPVSPGRVPARTLMIAPPLASSAAIASQASLSPVPSSVSMADETPLDPHAGPSSELLPLPGPDAAGTPDISLLPDAAGMVPHGLPTQTEGDAPPGTALNPDTYSGDGVPRSELAPAPAYGGVETQDRRGPVFRISGADAMKHARSRGFKFTPAGGIGALDGNHTAAAQFPNRLTSEVHGTRMTQLRPPPAWNLEESSNTFFMFCDANYNAARLAPGWRIRGIRLEGPAWRWVVCPVSGANTASFSIRVHAFKNQPAPTSVQLVGITIEGPEGATDWRDAFPNLNKSLNPSTAQDSPPSPRNLPPAGPAEPELPE